MCGTSASCCATACAPCAVCVTKSATTAAPTTCAFCITIGWGPPWTVMGACRGWCASGLITSATLRSAKSSRAWAMVAGLHNRIVVVDGPTTPISFSCLIKNASVARIALGLVSTFKRLSNVVLLMLALDPSVSTTCFHTSRLLLYLLLL